MAQNNRHASRSASSCEDGLLVNSFDLYSSLYLEHTCLCALITSHDHILRRRLTVSSRTQVYAKCHLYRHRYMQSATFTDTKTVTTVHRHTPVQQPSFQMNLGWPISSQFSDTSCPTMSFKDRWSDGGKGREVKRKYIPREVTGAHFIARCLHCSSLHLELSTW